MAQQDIITRFGELRRLSDVIDDALQKLDKQLDTIIKHKEGSGALGEKMMVSKARGSLEGLDNMKKIYGKLRDTLEIVNEIQIECQRPVVRPKIK